MQTPIPSMSPETAPVSPADEPRLVLRLYVAGDGPNSTAARANLARLLGACAPGSYAVEIVDCLQEPMRAIEEGVFVTPTLLRISPPPRRTIIGSLSESLSVSSVLGLDRTSADRP
ncbi:MAG TPA: circadian clock KaiB family protein [Gemmatimonadaceae bacterium]|nr:circadian clock KaiB family protein [Gemmatimonadaceae bacterium]